MAEGRDPMTADHDARVARLTRAIEAQLTSSAGAGPRWGLDEADLRILLDAIAGRQRLLLELEDNAAEIDALSDALAAARRAATLLAAAAGEPADDERAEALRAHFRDHPDDIPTKAEWAAALRRRRMPADTPHPARPLPGDDEQ